MKLFQVWSWAASPGESEWPQSRLSNKVWKPRKVLRVLYPRILVFPVNHSVISQSQGCLNQNRNDSERGWELTTRRKVPDHQKSNKKNKPRMESWLSWNSNGNCLYSVSNEWLSKTYKTRRLLENTRIRVGPQPNQEHWNFSERGTCVS